MGKVVCDLAISVDGFVAGPEQSLENPLGIGGQAVHRWHVEAREHNEPEASALTAADAFIMGRNMYGPERGPWSTHSDDEAAGDWTGWWGPKPPYEAPVYVLTHFPREPVQMQGGTTFHFVTDGIASALRQATAAAGTGDVAIAGGASTVNQYLRAGLLDELRLHIAPVLLGTGERLFTDVGDLDLQPISSRTTDLATHVTYRLPRSTQR